MKKKLTVVFMGDSCIDAGRDRTRPTESFGNGYVAMVTAMLRQRLPRIDFTFVNSGINGDTSAGCLDRWDADVAAYRPDLVVLAVGSNDAYLFSENNSPDFYGVKAYRARMEQMFTHAFAKGAGRMVLLGPHHLGRVDEDLSALITKNMPAVLPVYRRASRAVARKFGVVFLDQQVWFEKERERIAPTLIAPDYVHPTTYGNAMVAQHIADTLETMIRKTKNGGK